MALLQYQLWLLGPLVLMFVLFTALCVYVYYSTDRQYKLRFVLGPVLIMVTSVSFVLFGQHLGYAYPAPLPKQFVYLGHRVISSGSKKEWIEIYLLSRRPSSKESRLQRIPWSKDMEKQMEAAATIKNQGGTAIMERDDSSVKGGKSGQPGDKYPSYTTRKILPQEVMPKNPLPDGQHSPEQSEPREQEPGRYTT